MHFKKIALIALWFMTHCFAMQSAECVTSCTQSQTVYQPHAFSVSMAREILLEKQAFIGSVDSTELCFGTLGFGFEYMKSLSGEESCCRSIGSIPFWSQSNMMTIGNNSGSSNLDVYQLGMGPVSTTGTVTLQPQVIQTGLDILWYTGAHQAEQGCFLKIQGPLGVMKVQSCMFTTGNVEGVSYEEYQIADSDQSVAAPYKNIIEAFEGGKSAGDLQPMRFGRIIPQQSSGVKFGDISFTLGYTLFADEMKHIGAGLRITAPTGNKACATYVLEPIWGRNGHIGIGGEILAHWTLYCSKNEERYCNLWLDAIVEHLCESKHFRSFDLKRNGLGSKYLLLANYANNDYQNEIMNAINVTTFPVTSSFSYEANFALMIDYHHGNVSFGFGYEGWARSRETLTVLCDNPAMVDLSYYAILGRQNVRDGLCDPSATISKSLGENSIYAQDATVRKNRLPSGIEDLLDVPGQEAQKAYTSKVFSQIAYTYENYEYAPYIGISGAAELNHIYNNAISYWTVGLQTGFAF